MPWPVWMGSVAFLVVLLVVGLSVLRKRLRSPYELWQATHGVLAMVLVATAVIHIMAVGRFSAHAGHAGGVGGLPHRVRRPLRALPPAQAPAASSPPWEVVENRAEKGEARTIVLRPVGHAGFTPEPGQFGWVGFGRSPSR